MVDLTVCIELWFIMVLQFSVIYGSLILYCDTLWMYMLE